MQGFGGNSCAGFWWKSCVGFFFSVKPIKAFGLKSCARFWCKNLCRVFEVNLCRILVKKPMQSFVLKNVQCGGVQDFGVKNLRRVLGKKKTALGFALKTPKPKNW